MGINKTDIIAAKHAISRLKEELIELEYAVDFSSDDEAILLDELADVFYFLAETGKALHVDQSDIAAYSAIKGASRKSRGKDKTHELILANAVLVSRNQVNR